MRVLLLSQYFTPEVTAASARVHAFAAGLASRGHAVEVICEVPNHPTGVIAEGFRGKALVRRRMDGFTVRYVWVKATPRRSATARIVNYSSFCTAAVLAGSLGPRPDVVLVSSPPLPAAAAAALLGCRHRVPWVMDVRDLWPEAALALGELSPGRLVGALERLERRLYRSAGAVVTVTDPFRRHIEALVGDPTKVSVIPNGTTRLWLDAGNAEADRAGLALPADRFVWTYAGNLGRAQGMESAVEAAALLGDRFHLEIAGTGACLADLRELSERSSGSVGFRGLIEPAKAAQLLRASDATLVSLAAAPALAKYVPSKLFDCCAVGRPVVVSAAGEAVRLAVGAGAALSAEPGNPRSLAAAVRRLADDPVLAADLGAAGRRFATGYLREHQIEELERVLTATGGLRTKSRRAKDL